MRLEPDEAFAATERTLVELRDALKVIELDQAAAKRWMHAGGWWEVSSYRQAVDDALYRIRRCRKRHQKILEQARAVEVER